jgi:hypothetical protein
MARLTQFTDDQVARLFQLYSDAETEILNEINRGLLRGNDLKYLQTMLQNSRAIITDLLNGSRTWCEQAIPGIYVQGANNADQMLTARGEKVAAGFGGIHQQAAQVLAESAYDRFNDVGNFIGRRVDDIYRNLALENVKGSVIGYKTYQRVARNYREQLAEQGVTGFKDAAGRQWNMRTYAEMVARTTTMEAHLQGTANRLLENGHDLVKVSTHAGACAKCIPWQGKVLSLTGQTPGYPSLQEAKDAGLFHPNCEHSYGLSINLDEEIEKLEEKLGEGAEPAAAAKASDIPVSGLDDAAKPGIAQALSDALDHGVKTNTECLLTLDAKTGNTVYNKVAGTGSEVQFPQQLIDFLSKAPARSVMLVHNHPSSSAFSDADVQMVVRFDSVNGMFISAHDGTKYYVGKLSNTGKIRESQVAAEYQRYITRYFKHYSDLVRTGKMTSAQAWNEHTHKIMEDLSSSLGLDYRRWDAP